MRPIGALAVGLAAAGTAHAQTISPYAPYATVSPYHAAQSPKPAGATSFAPYKPPAYLNPDLPNSPANPYPHMRRTPGVPHAERPATPADPYPSLHPHRRHDPNDGF